MNVEQTTRKSLGWITLGVATLALLFIAGTVAQAATPNWDVSGNWDVDFEYGGTDYTHDVTLTQANDGTLTGSGGHPADGSPTFTWVVTSGSVSGDDITFTADYTADASAVTPLTTMTVVGTIAEDGTMSGTWSDNYQGQARAGTWSTDGTADNIETDATLAAEDFGVMDQSGVKGYTAGFGLTEAMLSDVESIEVKLYSGATLLQTNTATDAVEALAGSQFSSPFDVFGTFDYVADGYWVNDRETEYGQTLIPTKVVATVTLEDGTVLTAENTNLTGDPSTIFPVTPPPTGPTAKSQCMNGGWMTFNDPAFKNQGQCVAHVNREARLMR